MSNLIECNDLAEEKQFYSQMSDKQGELRAEFVRCYYNSLQRDFFPDEPSKEYWEVCAHIIDEELDARRRAYLGGTYVKST